MIKKLITTALFAVVVVLSTTLIFAASGDVTITTNPSSNITPGQDVNVTVRVTLNPDTDNDEFNKLVVDIPEGFTIDEDTINTSDELGLFGDYTIENNQLIFEINDVIVGSTIELNFTGTFDDSIKDNGDYTFNATISTDSDSKSDSVTVTTSNPTEYDITKTVVSPEGNIYPGDEVVYDIDVTFSGNGDIDYNNITIEDDMQDGAIFSEASEGYEISGDIISWQLTEDEANQRSAHKTVTYIIDEEYFNAEDEIVNNASIKVNGQVVAENSAEIKLKDNTTIIIDEPVGKVSYTSTDGDGNATSIDGDIVYKFEPIDFKGSATVDNFYITDEVGEHLVVETINFGEYEGGGELESVVITYDDGTPDTVITDFSNPYEVAPILTDHVETVTYNYGTVQLPFKATTPPSIEMSLDDDVNDVSDITNDFSVGFDISSSEGEIGNGEYVCPPPFEQTNTNTNDADCSLEGTDHVVITNNTPFVNLTEKLVEDRTYYHDEELEIEYTIYNDSDSLEDVNLANLVNDYPDELQYVSTDSEYNLQEESGYFILDSNLTLEPGDIYTYTVTYKVIEDEVADLEDNVYAYFVEPYKVIAGNEGKFVKETVDYLKDGETDSRVLNNNTDLLINPPRVNIDKTNTDDEKTYLPDGIDDGDNEYNDEINYEVTLTNVDFGKQSADLHDPVIEDVTPEYTSLMEETVEVSGYFDNSNLSSITTNDDGFSFNFIGDLPVGETVVVNYSLKVEENISAGNKNNVVNFEKDDITYEENSVFTDNDNSALVKPVATQLVAKKVNEEVIAPGGQVTYTFTYANTGTVDISDIVFSDLIPAYDDGRGTTIDGVVVESPEFTDGDVGDLTFSYILDNDEEVDKIPFDRTEIKIVKMDFGNYTIKPGEEFTFIFTMTSPNDSVDGDVIRNDATFESIGYYEDTEYAQLKNTTNQVETNIVEPEITETEIGDLVYLDVNRNGTFDSDVDETLDNYTVALHDDTGKVIKETVTNNGGQYMFTNLSPANYSVSISSDSGDYLLMTESFSIDTSNENNYDADFRYEPAMITGTLFEDLNANGVYDLSTESLYSYVVEMTLFDSDGNMQTTTTDSGSSYIFDNLKAGEYTIIASDQYTDFEFYYTVQVGYNIGEESHNQSTTFDLIKGSEAVKDFGLVQPATIFGYNFEDFENDGTYVADQQLQDVNMTLSGDMDDSTTTNEDGYYKFLVYPGTYNVTSELVDSHQFSPKDNDSSVNSSGITDDIVVDAGGSIRKDVGQVPLVDIGGSYYEDVDYSQDFSSGTDEYLEDRTVYLYEGDTELASTKTDENGVFEFVDLKPDTIYTLKFDKEAEEIFVLPNQTSEVNIGEIKPGQSDYSTIISVYTPVTLSGSVVIDMDYSQNLNDVDSPVANKDVNIIDEYSGKVDTVSTDDDGQYTSNPLPPGTYYLEIDTDVDYYEVPKGDLTLDDSFKFDDSESDSYTLYSGESAKNINKGQYQLVDISGVTAEDVDANGILGPPDDLPLDMKVELYKDGEYITETMSSNANFIFEDLLPGNYSVKFITDMQPTLMDVTGGTDSEVNSNYYTTEILVKSGEQNSVDFDGGFYNYASIGNLIYFDGNEDGSFDVNNESVASGVTVNLLDSQGVVVKTTTTTESIIEANYLFSDVVPGTYQVQAINIDGYEYQDVTDGLLVQSDDNALSNTFTIGSGDEVYDKDGRLVLDFENPGNYVTTIGDLVFEDLNYNGLQDEGEQGVSGVEVELYNKDNVLLDSTTTDNLGIYSFNVLPGEYKVKFITPTDYYVTLDSVGNDVSIDSDYVDNNGFTDLFNVDIDREDMSLDQGYYQYGSISGTVVVDEDYDLLLDDEDTRMSGYEVELYDDVSLISSTTTDSNGEYTFYNLKPGEYVVKIKDGTYLEVPSGTEEKSFKFTDEESDVLTLSSNQDITDINKGLYEEVEISGYTFEDINADGLKDTDEVLSIDVSLLLDGEVIDNVKSDNDGYFEFTNLVPGNYSVKFDTDYVVTESDVTGGIDSESKDDYTAPEVLVTSGTSNSIDFDGGFYQYASIGDLIFVDGDKDEIYDPDTERVAPFITVTLHDASTDEVVATTKTTTSDTDSNYLFENVKPGSYYVVAEDVSGFKYQNIDGGLLIDDSLDAGVSQPATSEEFTVVSNQDLTTIDGRLILDKDDDTFLKTTLGDFIFEDSNYNGIQDKNESGISGAQVELYNTNGMLIYDVTSDENGSYSLDVAPGEYKVKVTVPGEYVSTYTSESDIDSLDSQTLDEDGFTDDIVVDILNPDDTIDFGYYIPATISGQYFYDNNRDLTKSNNDLKLENQEVVLSDYEGNEIARTTTDENGNYEFDDLTPGSYRVVFTYPEDEYLHLADYDNNVKVDVFSGDNVTDIDYGYYINSEISGYYYRDNDDSESITDTDDLLSGVNVQLLLDNDVISSTTTDEDGYYEFVDVVPGNYQIVFDYELKDNEEYQDIEGFKDNIRYLTVEDDSIYENENGAVIIKEDVIIDTGLITYTTVIVLTAVVLLLVIIKKNII